MANSFDFTLDPSCLPQLTSKGDNYGDWRSAWQIAFEWAGVWDTVEQKPPTSTTTTTTTAAAAATAATTSTTDSTTVATWKKNNNKALVLLMSAVHSDHLHIITTATSAHNAWNTLRKRYDRDTAHSIIHQFRRLTSMRYDNNDDLVTHLDTFHKAWSLLERRCTSSTQELAKNLSPFFPSETIKGSFFLATLPESMDHVIENLLSRNINKFVDIEPHMLDIAERRALKSSRPSQRH